MKLILIFVIIILSSSILIANEVVSLELKEGQNNITINQYFPAILVKELVSINPKIQSVTLKEFSLDLGYVNVFGGVGTNFFFEPNKNYEIYSREDLVIYLYNP